MRNVRSGSKAALTAPKSNFRFAPESGLNSDIACGPKSAKSDRTHRYKREPTRSPCRRARGVRDVRHGQTERFGGFEIDDQFKCSWLLNWEVFRLGALQDFVNVHGSLAIQVGKSRGVRHQPAFLGEPPRH